MTHIDEVYEQDLIDWAQSYQAYERITDRDDLRHVIYEPIRDATTRLGDIPEWVGVDLLRGWAFYIARGHRWSGHGSILDYPEFELIIEAVRRHPAAEPRDMPPRRHA